MYFLKCKKRKLRLTLTGLAFSCLLSQVLFAAPYWGMVTKIHQPGGYEVEAKIYGDEFYAQYESFEGFSLVKDPATGWYSYAMKNTTDTNKLESTGIPYKSSTATSEVLESLTNLGVQKHLTESAAEIGSEVDSMRSKYGFKFEKIRNMEDIRAMNASNAASKGIIAPRAATKTGSVVGLVVLVDFSDDRSTIGQADVDSFANQFTGYNRNGNNGSVRRYYSDVSNGRIDFTNHVTAYYRARNPKTYYTDTTVGWCVRAGELLTEALTDLENNQKYDFSTLSYDPVSRKVLAVSLFYAGVCPNNFRQGLWPGSTALGTPFIADGVKVTSFQFTDMGNNLTIHTFCHECGHMVMSFPDLYEYTDPDTSKHLLSSGVGGFCIMCNGMSATNPVPPCAPLRIIAGWETTTNLSNTATNTNFSITANNNTSFVYSNLSTTNEKPEWFCLENRARTGRNTNLPGAGMLIWHVEEQSGRNPDRGKNAGTCSDHYYVSLEQADGARHLETTPRIPGDAHDPFPNGGLNQSFTDATSPNANWYCNTLDGNSRSHFSISNISNAGDTMTFTYSNDLVVANVQHPATINQDPINQQTITVSTGVNGQQIHVWGTDQFIGATTKTTAGGAVTFTILAAHPDVITVDVYGGGQRYRGYITIVSASWPTGGLVFSKAGVQNMVIDLSGNCYLMNNVIANNTYAITNGLLFKRPSMSIPVALDGGAIFTSLNILQRQSGLTPVPNDLQLKRDSDLLTTIGESQQIKITGTVWEEIQ
jgi:M6 family metalloprotease-like protein